MNHYDNGYKDGFEDLGTRYPSSTDASLTDFESYQNGYLDGTIERLKRASQKLVPLFTKPFVVRLNQRVIAHTSIRVLVNAVSEEEAIQKALEEEGIVRTAPREYDDTDEILSEAAEIIPEDDPEWEW